ncbi:TolC family protein [Aquimarina algiphila]|uniref:TolC family protein n=1 Tax=Aquimarina algiphila TaxID=2047982 RepID=UPI00248FAF97|nr:TolC family protein [Aquimarina algiphila]
MKKNILFLVLLCFSAMLSAQKRNYNIGILTDYQTPKVIPLLTKLKSEIRSVVGEDATINFPEESTLVNNYNLDTALQNYNTLLANDTDIILAFGIINNQIISKQKLHQKPTILFGAVNRDFNGIDLTKKTSGINNFTYLVESESFKEDFETFKELTNFKNLGIAIDAPFVDVLPLKETFDRELQALQSNYKLIPFNKAEDISSNLDGIDAIYMAGGFFLKEEENIQLAKVFMEKKLPSFTINGTEDVQNGFMATNQSNENLEQFFRRIALTVEAQINGASLADLPVFIDYTPRLTINFNTAEVIGVPIKYSLIAQTDFVGEFKNVLSEKQYDLLSVINDALNDNLSIRADQKDVDLSNQDIKTAKSNYLPSLTASGTGTYVDPDAAEVSNGQSPEFSTSGNVTLQQTIFSESANANIVIQKKLQKAQEEIFNAAQLDLIFNASNTYFNTLILKTNTQIQVQNLELTKKNLQIAEQNFEAGQSGKSDLLRFRSEMAQNTQAMVEAINQLEQGFITLNQVLNNPINLEISVEDVMLDEGIFEEYNYDEIAELLDDPSLREPFIEFLVEEAKKNAPELKSLMYNLEATDRNIKLNSYGRFLPTVALQGQYNRTFSRSGKGSVAPAGFQLVDDNYNVGLNVSIPIFNQNRTNINRQTAMIQKDQIEINKENTELSIAANIRTGVLNMVNQISNIELSRVSEETAKEALELTQASYSSGSVNIVQLLDAQNNLLNAQLARANATYNYLINSLQLERFLGYYFLLNSDQDNNEFKQRFFEFLNTRN